MLEAILQEFHTSTYDFRSIAHTDDPLRDRFPAWVDYYRLKWAIARTLKPQSILEIGVRYGYSAHAFLDAMSDSHYVGIDLDCELAGGVKGAINWAKQILDPFNADLIVADSQAMSQFPGDRYDLIHVDGQQDGDSSFHDLKLAIAQGDYVLVDGYHWSPTNFQAVNDFLHQYRDRIDWYGVIPGYAGELLIKPHPPTVKPPIDHSRDLQSAYDRTYYTQSCHGHESFARYQGQRLEDERLIAAATIASLKSPGHVLDLGCGRGELALHLAQQGHRVTAIDYSEAAIALAQSCFAASPQSESPVTFHCADVNTIDLPLAHYDLVIATDLIEHLNPAEVAQLYDRINRWLKPDGLFILHTFPNRWYYDYDYARKRRLAQDLGAYLPQDPRTDYERLMHINEQSPRQLNQQLHASFAHHQFWFASAELAQLSGSLWRSFTHREMAAAPSLYAIASPSPLPYDALQSRLETRPIGWWRSRQLRHQLACTIVESPTHVRPRQTFEIQMRLANHSPDVLHSLGDYPIFWSYRWLDRAGATIVASGDRTRIFPPSKSTQIANMGDPYYVRIIAPNQAGQYILRITLVQEQVRWFDQSPIDLKQTQSITVV
jgi:2-polyprenyl-3-methyl-5-hydroxy-6-metoxy-1,4-benzoquinol methylase